MLAYPHVSNKQSRVQQVTVKSFAIVYNTGAFLFSRLPLPPQSSHRKTNTKCASSNSSVLQTIVTGFTRIYCMLQGVSRSQVPLPFRGLGPGNELKDTASVTNDFVILCFRHFVCACTSSNFFVKSLVEYLRQVVKFAQHKFFSAGQYLA